MKTFFVPFLVLLALTLATSLSSMALAQEEAENPVIAATEDGVMLPAEELVAGIVTLTFQNDTQAPFSPILARLNEGKTMEDFMGAMQQGPAAALAVVTILGGPEVGAESSAEVTYELLAGDYLLLSFASDGPPALLPFSVTEKQGETGEAPEADVEVSLVDFAFAITAELKTGEQLWEIANLGEQPHEMFVFRVDDDATLSDVTEALTTAMMSAEAGPPEMPFETAFAWTPMSPDTRAWVEVDLEPGTYAVVCFIPDTMSEAMVSHLEHGMIRLVTVSE
jgi:hypothetical protein